MASTTFTDEDTSYNPHAHLSSSLSDPTALSSLSLFTSSPELDADEPIIPRPTSTFTQRPLRSRPSVWELAKPTSAPSTPPPAPEPSFNIPTLMTRASGMLGSLRGPPSTSPERGRPRASYQERLTDLFQGVSSPPSCPSPSASSSAYYPSTFSAAFPSSTISPRASPTATASKTLQSAANFLNQGLTGLMGVSLPKPTHLPADDPIWSIDVRAALLPSKHHPEHAFDALLHNAESLVARMRAAHFASSNRSSASAAPLRRDDEADEARLRARGLRTRLDTPVYARSESVSSQGSEDGACSVFSYGGSCASSLGEDEDGIEDVDLDGEDGMEGLSAAEQVRVLKARVAELEGVVHGCLGLVDGGLRF